MRRLYNPRMTKPTPQTPAGAARPSADISAPPSADASAGPPASPRLGKRLRFRIAAFARGPLGLASSFLGLSLLFFWRLWARLPADRMIVGAADGDFMRQFYPYRAFVARAWGTAKPPLWNPHQYAGTPAWADPQLAVLYPFRWLQAPLALLLGRLPLWTVELEAIGHVALGGFFTLLLLRQLGASLPAAFFSGLAFGFGGYLTGYPVEQLAVLDTAVWIPALLWALTRWLDGVASDGKPGALAPLIDRRLLTASVFMALAVYAGHPQTALYALWAGLFWLIIRGRGLGIRPARLALLGLFWMALSAALSAAQWLPTATFLRRSARSIDPSEVAAGLPVRDIVQVLAPGVISQWSPLYVGVIPLLLALWGAARVRAARPWAVLALGAWTVSLGGNSPLFGLYRFVLPGMTLFRHQERIAVLVSLGLAVAAGLALDRLLGGGATPSNAPEDDPLPKASAALVMGLSAGLLLFAGAILALRLDGQAGPVRDFCTQAGRDLASAAVTLPMLGAGLAGPLLFSALFLALAGLLFWMRDRSSLNRSGLATGLLLLCALELFSVNRGAALCPRPIELTQDARLEALLPKARDGRVSSEARLPYGPNAASVFGLYDVTGDSPLQLGNVAALIDRVPEILWWRILNVRYVLSDRPPEGAPLELLVGPGSAPDDSGEAAADDPAAASLYAVQLPVPPVWIPERLRCGSPSSTRWSGWCWMRGIRVPTAAMHRPASPSWAASPRSAASTPAGSKWTQCCRAKDGWCSLRPTSPVGAFGPSPARAWYCGRP
jgi:hypothetical protein